MDLSNRSTVSKKIPEIDSLYVYHTRHEVKKLVQRQQPGENYRYKNHKALEVADEGEIYIYHRTATIDGVRKGVTIVTKEHRKTKIDTFIKDSLKLLNDKQKEIFKTAKQSPTELGFYYLAQA